MEIFKNSIKELIFKGSPAEFGVAAQAFFDELKGNSPPFQKQEKDPATGKKKPRKLCVIERRGGDEEGFRFFIFTFCFAISPDPLLPDANPVHLMIEVPLHSDSQACDQYDQSEVVAHRLPGGKSRLAMVALTLKGPYADGIPNSTFWWEKLKAELERQGWMEKTAKLAKQLNGLNKLQRGIIKAIGELRNNGPRITNEAIARNLAHNVIVSPKNGEMYSREWVSKERNKLKSLGYDVD